MQIGNKTYRSSVGVLALFCFGACGSSASDPSEGRVAIEDMEATNDAEALRPSNHWPQALAVDVEGWQDAAAWEARDRLAGPPSDAMRNGGPAAVPRRQLVQWGPCPDGFRSECATLRVPLDWENLARGTIQIFFTRYRALNPNRQKVRQLWFLIGGPSSPEGWEGSFDTWFAPWHQDYDLYTMEYRGIGDSTRLGCPAEEDPASDGQASITPSEWPACVAYLQSKWGKELGAFGMTNSARDLKYLIYRTKEAETQPVFLHGHSYGTMLAQRFLQIAPSHVSGVMLDSVVAPDKSLFDDRFQYDPVGKDLAALCDRDPICGAKLGGHAWDFARTTLAKLDDPTHCPALATNSFAFGDLAAALLTSRRARLHLFPLLYRASRCDPADVAAIAQYHVAIGYPFEPLPVAGRDSDPMGANIFLSEHIGPRPPSVNQMRADCESATFCPADLLDSRNLYEIWPRYRTDRYAYRWPRTSTPILAVNGDLDPSTPYQQAARIQEHLHGPSQNYVQVPYATHGAIVSPVRTAGQPSCVLQMMLNFTEDPAHRPDVTCLSDLLPITFDISADDAQRFFGQPDAWEN